MVTLDEFDTMRLGRHHRVEEWLEERTSSPSPAAGRGYQPPVTRAMDS